jgi:monofunctional glycosyltransferase
LIDGAAGPAVDDAAVPSGSSDSPTPAASPGERGRLRTIVRWVAIAAAATLLAPLPVVLAMRWIDPPASAFMIERALGRTHAQRRARDAPAAPARREPAPRTNRVARLLGVDYRWTDLEEIAPAMALAVVAAEDQHFPSHFGFDLDSIRDAVNERGRRSRVRGASTLTQQVAKNLFLWPGRSLVRKGLEAWLSAAIELLWPKRRILEIYLNIAELGPDLYGVGAAAPIYFGKPPANLTRHEAALLAAALPDPGRRRPDRPSRWLGERASWIETQCDQLGGAAYLSHILPAPDGAR